jgi:hypothetical protein
MAGGPWSPALVGQGRPGLFINFLPTAIAAISPGATGVVATILKAGWGPDNSVQIVDSRADINNFYNGLGAAADVSPNNARYSLNAYFDGGAQSILTYRIEGAGAAKGTNFLKDSVGTPANAIRIDGKYNGVRANNFFFTVSANAADATKTDVSLYEGTSLLATWTNKNVNRGVAGHMADIAATINNDPNNYWITATLVGADGGTTASTPTSVAAPGTQLAGGSDGAAPVLADYVTAMAALEGNFFNVFHTDVLEANLTGITTGIKNWILGMRNYGRYVTWVTGSDTGESVATALTNITALNAEYVSYVYPGAKQFNAAGNLTTYRGSAFAAQIAGARASLQPGEGLTYRVLQNIIDLERRPTNSELIQLDNTGGMGLFFDGTNYRIDKGNTTLINLTTAYPGKTLPASFKKASVINTVDSIANAVTASANLNYVGQIRNDEDGDKALVGVVRDFLKFMQGQRAIKAGFSVGLDPNNPSTGANVFLAWTITPVDTTDYIYNTVTIGT